MNDNYDDIINLPHPDPKRHQRMSMEARAAQFAPFAALTGYGDAIKDTARQQEADMIEEPNSRICPTLGVVLDVSARKKSLWQ